jgi:hypothetical protein
MGAAAVRRICYAAATSVGIARRPRRAFSSVGPDASSDSEVPFDIIGAKASCISAAANRLSATKAVASASDVIDTESQKNVIKGSD